MNIRKSKNVFDFIFIKLIILFAVFAFITACGSDGGDDDDVDDGGSVTVTLQSGGTDYIFTEGFSVDVGGFLDVNGNSIMDDGDYMTGTTVTINGDMVVDLIFPDDFTLIANSGTLTVRITGGGSAPWAAPNTIYLGCLKYDAGAQIVLADADESVTLQEDGVDYIFAGGLTIDVGGFLDMNSNEAMNDLEYMAGDSATISGDTVYTFDISDFTQLNNCGELTLQVTNANTAHGGRTFYGGSIQFDAGGAVDITSDDVSVTLQSGGVNYSYYGGANIDLGGFIDVNSNGILDNGDYMAGDNITVNGNETITFDYPADFTQTTACGTITFIITGTAAQSGVTFYAGSLDADAEGSVVF